MIVSVHLWSFYSLISHENTSKNECMNSRSLWNNTLGSRDIGDARGEGKMPGLAGMQAIGCFELWVKEIGACIFTTYSQSFISFRRRLITSSFFHGKLSCIMCAQSWL